MSSPGHLSARPLARTTELISQEVGDELVVYDERNQAAHALAPAAAAVWRLCDGTLSPVAIGARLGLEPTVVDAALAQLENCALLDRPTPLQVLPPSPDRGFDPDRDRSPELSRRQAAKRFATLGGTALGVSLIYSVTIGPATAAASTCTANGARIPAASTCSAASGHYATVSPSTACCGHGCANDAGLYYCSSTTTGTCTVNGGTVTVVTSCCSGAGTCTLLIGSTCVSNQYKCS